METIEVKGGIVMLQEDTVQYGKELGPKSYEAWPQACICSAIKTRLVSTIACVLLSLSPAGAASYTYNLVPSVVNGALDFSGTVTTDVDTGTLALSDIKAWNITVSLDPSLMEGSASFTLTDSNSNKFMLGSDLSATPSTLKFYYSDPDPTTAGYLEFQLIGIPGADVDWEAANCPMTNPACGHEQDSMSALLQTGGGMAEWQYGFTGDLTIATRGGSSCVATEVCATPLPAALPLFAGGLGVIGFFGTRKRRRARPVFEFSHGMHEASFRGL
jgi:hypothetical protein